MLKEDVVAEANILGQYLVGKRPTKLMIDLYKQAIRYDVLRTGSESAILSLALRRPALLPFLDSGAALIAPDTALRRRLYVMFAIIEASPRDTKLFMPIKKNPPYFIYMGLVGVGAVAKAILGVMLIKTIRTK